MQIVQIDDPSIESVAGEEYPSRLLLHRPWGSWTDFSAFRYSRPTLGCRLLVPLSRALDEDATVMRMRRDGRRIEADVADEYPAREGSLILADIIARHRRRARRTQLKIIAEDARSGLDSAPAVPPGRSSSISGRGLPTDANLT